MSSALRHAAQQALECLESLQGGCTDSGDGTVEAITVWCPEVIDALRAALAQKHDPVAHSGWVLREVLFDNGEPIGHREPQHSPAALAQQAEAVATVTECEACFTPDVCQLRGTCDYYTASQMRIAAPPQQAEPVLQTCNFRWDGEVQVQQCTRAHGIGEEK